MFIYFAGGIVTDDTNSCNGEMQQVTTQQQTMVTI